MTYKYDVTNNVLLNKGEKIPLVPITAEKIKELRIKQKNFLILKRGKDIYYHPTNSKRVSIELDNFLHKCPDCLNFFKCPKVLETVPESLTDENYEGSCRIEKYSFISFGYEHPNSFCVWKCKKFIASSSYKKSIDRLRKKIKELNIDGTNEKLESSKNSKKSNKKKNASETPPNESDFTPLFPYGKKHQELLALNKIIDDISP